MNTSLRLKLRLGRQMGHTFAEVARHSGAHRGEHRYYHLAPIVVAPVGVAEERKPAKKLSFFCTNQQ
jgi:hypothetical protein